MYCDDDQSGALNEQFRADYARLNADIEAGKIALLCCIDISRLHRDSTMMQAHTIVRSMGWKKVKVLTQISSQWKLLDMSLEEHRNTYITTAKDAAAERQVLRARLMSSKITSVKAGNASGGGTVPFGWGVTAPVSKYASDDGQKHYSRYIIYPPHARLKIEIIRASLLPHITTLPALNRYLMGNGFSIPPFEEWARFSAARSVLRNVCRKIAGKRIYHRPDADSLYDFGDAFLLSAITEPLMLGDCCYGSGQSGHYAKEKHKQMSDVMRQTPDSKITAGRFLVDNRPFLALSRDNDPELPALDDLIALWEQGVRKWSPIDLIAARKTGYRYDYANLPVNLERCNRSENKPSRAKKTVNPWHDWVYCGKHGWDAETNCPNLHEKMFWGTHGNAAHEQWFCSANDNDHSTSHLCSTWSSAALRNILDAHVKRRLHLIVNGDEALFASVYEQRKQAEDKIERLKSHQSLLEAERTNIMREYNDFCKVLHGAPDNQRDKILRTIQDKLTPLLQLIEKCENDLQDARRGVQDAAEEKTAEAIRQDLTWALNRYDSLEVSRKRLLISLLVNHVVVMVGDGCVAPECVILFTWSNGQTDVLVGWRDYVQDERNWLPEEDDAIRRLWASGCDYSTIKGALQPGRKFHSIKRRARALNAGQRGKLRAIPLVKQAQIVDSTWHDRHPNVLYLRLAGYELGDNVAMCHHHTADAANEWSRRIQSVDIQVFRGVQLTIRSSCCRGGASAGAPS